MKKINYDKLPTEFRELYTRALDSSLGLASLQVEGYTLNGDDRTIFNMMRQDSALQYAKSEIDPSKNKEYTYKFDLFYQLEKGSSYFGQNLHVFLFLV